MSVEQTANSGSGPRSVVRVRRVTPGETIQVWTWSPNYQGTLTHYARGGTELCQGSDCPPSLHRSPIYWKGYAAVGIWSPTRSVWEPSILEMTENLELDFRGRWERGQVWELARARQSTRRKTPVGAVLLTDSLGVEPPPPFDMVDTLCRFYHSTILNLGVVNPLPPRTLVGDTVAPAPPSRLTMEREKEKQLADETPMKAMKFSEIRKKMLEQKEAKG